MRKAILFLTLVPLMFYSCKTETAEEKLNKNIERLSTMLNEALNSQETILDIPIGFVLNCTVQEYRDHITELVSKYGKGEYTVKCNFLGLGKKDIWLMGSHYFSDPNTMTDTICEVDFGIKQNTAKLEVALDSFLSDYESVVIDIENHYRKFWRKGNMVVYLNSSRINPLVHVTFCNLPKSGNCGLSFLEDIQHDIDYQVKWKLKKEQQKKDEAKKVKVENSPWDGSVYQVKKYVKSNLKDPSSYESIEWSPVQKTDRGYVVRHKFRAKNSFGGYVVEEYIITLNDCGEVVDAVKTE